MSASGEPVNTAEFPAARLAAKVKAVRESLGLTQGQLASQVGYSRTYVTLIESGRIIPGKEVARLLGKALDAQERLLELRAEAEADKLASGRFERRRRGARIEQQSGIVRATDDRLILYEVLILGFEALGVSLHRRRFLQTIGASAASLAINRSASQPGARQLRALIARVEDRGRVDPGLVGDMDAVVASYRRFYRQFSAEELLVPTLAHLRLTSQLAKSASASPARDQLVSSIGEASMLAGTLLAHDMGDFETASAYYRLTEIAAKRLDHHELTAYLLGCMSFLACYSGRWDEAVTLIDRAVSIAERFASPKTRAWLLAVAGEIHATVGDAVSSLNSLDASRRALQEADHDDPSWLGIGAFDEAKLDGYYGTCYLRLHQANEAYESLSVALDRLDQSCLKHRCTTLCDLATALVGMREVEAACQRGIQAAEIILALQHAVNVDRLRKLRKRLQRWATSPAVQEFDSYLALVA